MKKYFAFVVSLLPVFLTNCGNTGFCKVHDMHYEHIEATCQHPGYDRYYCSKCTFEETKNLTPTVDCSGTQHEVIEGCKHTFTTNCQWCGKLLDQHEYYVHNNELIEMPGFEDDYYKCKDCGAVTPIAQKKVPLTSNLADAIHGDILTKASAELGIEYPSVYFNSYGQKGYALSEVEITLMNDEVIYGTDVSSKSGHIGLCLLDLFNYPYEGNDVIIKSRVVLNHQKLFRSSYTNVKSIKLDYDLINFTLEYHCSSDFSSFTKDSHPADWDEELFPFTYNVLSDEIPAGTETTVTVPYSGQKTYSLKEDVTYDYVKSHVGAGTSNTVWIYLTAI